MAKTFSRNVCDLEFKLLTKQNDFHLSQTLNCHLSFLGFPMDCNHRDIIKLWRVIDVFEQFNFDLFD